MKTLPVGIRLPLETINLAEEAAARIGESRSTVLALAVIAGLAHVVATPPKPPKPKRTLASKTVFCEDCCGTGTEDPYDNTGDGHPSCQTCSGKGVLYPWSPGYRL